MSGWLFALGLLLAFALGLCLRDLALFATGGREPKAVPSPAESLRRREAEARAMEAVAGLPEGSLRDLYLSDPRYGPGQEEPSAFQAALRAQYEDGVRRSREYDEERLRRG